MRGGFTMTELLIVMGIIVLMATLAIPAFSIISNGRSRESAENTVAALIGRARMDAIGIQEPRGVAFFRDPGSGRATAVEVYNDQPGQYPIRVEMVSDRDPVMLPQGIGLQMMIDSVAATAGHPESSYSLMGVIMFDAYGRLSTQRWEIPGLTGSSGARSGSKNNLTALVSPLPSAPYTPPSGANQAASIGFILYENESYDGWLANLSASKFWEDGYTPYLINRYNGSLVRGE